MKNESWLHVCESDKEINVAANSKGLEELVNAISLKLKFGNDVNVIIGDDFGHKLVRISIVSNLE